MFLSKIKYIATLGLSILLLSTVPLMASSDAPTLKLWLKGSFFKNPANTCESDTPQKTLDKLQKTKPFMTENDLLQWDQKPFSAAMKPSLFSQHRKMEDQCFVMQMGNEMISGVILSVNSSHMLRLPTIIIYDANQTMELLNFNTRALP
jgi:hypothetical protein